MKLVPESVTSVPSGPDRGVKPTIVGGPPVTATVRLILTACVRVPDVPVTVTGTVPVVAELLAVSVKLLVLAVLLGLNDAVTPVGRP